MEVFAQGGDIYCSSASQMFKVPVQKHGVNGHLRQKGKVAELACGYGGGVGALRAFGADKMGLTEPEMADIVAKWRLTSPTIPRFWRAAEQAAKQALQTPGRRCPVTRPALSEHDNPLICTYYRDTDALRCELPSGRKLSYWDARLDVDGSICFMGQNQTTRKWEKTGTWGGKLVENIVQAYARDCLAVALLRLDAAGYNIIFHVHDEIIAEAPDGARWEDMAAIMGQPIDWAPGLLLRAEGYSTKFYLKD
jgi:DNA polymerase